MERWCNKRNTNVDAQYLSVLLFVDDLVVLVPKYTNPLQMKVQEGKKCCKISEAKKRLSIPAACHDTRKKNYVCSLKKIKYSGKIVV